jgi:hypothetical protein
MPIAAALKHRLRFVVTPKSPLLKISCAGHVEERSLPTILITRVEKVPAEPLQKNHPKNCGPLHSHHSISATASHKVDQCTKPVAAGAQIRPAAEAAHIRPAVGAQGLVPLARDCLVHRMRPRKRPPAGRRTAGRRNTNSHRPTTNSRSVPSDTRRDTHAQAPKQRGRNGAGQSDGECPLFLALGDPDAARSVVPALPDPDAVQPQLLVLASLAEAVAPLPTATTRQTSTPPAPKPSSAWTSSLLMLPSDPANGELYFANTFVPALGRNGSKDSGVNLMLPSPSAI